MTTIFESNEETATGMDLNAYLRRIGYAGDLCPTREVLEALHLAHVTHIPFENLDVMLKRPIFLDAASLQAKLVSAGRGGYCFEQNGLFSAVMVEAGFTVTNLAARVLYRATRVRPRTHMMLLVEVDGRRLLADVGFGATGLFVPVDIDDNTVRGQFVWRYRIAERDGLRVLQSVLEGEWTDLYEFSLEPQLPADYEMANYYVSTSPDSYFTTALTVQKLAPEARHTVRGTEYSMDRGDRVTKIRLQDVADLGAFIAETFGLSLPAGYRYELGEAGIQVRRDETQCL